MDEDDLTPLERSLKGFLSGRSEAVRVQALEAMSKGRVYETIESYVKCYPSEGSHVYSRVDEFLKYYQAHREEFADWTAAYSSLLNVQYQILTDYFIENAGDMFG